MQIYKTEALLNKKGKRIKPSYQFAAVRLGRLIANGGAGRIDIPLKDVDPSWFVGTLDGRRIPIRDYFQWQYRYDEMTEEEAFEVGFRKRQQEERYSSSLSSYLSRDEVIESLKSWSKRSKPYLGAPRFTSCPFGKPELIKSWDAGYSQAVVEELEIALNDWNNDEEFRLSS